jgi:hypothetical protein
MNIIWLTLVGTKLVYIINEHINFGEIILLGNVNVHCHDHCQNNNECASGKAKRGFGHPIINFKGIY